MAEGQIERASKQSANRANTTPTMKNIRWLSFTYIRQVILDEIHFLFCYDEEERGIDALTISAFC